MNVLAAVVILCFRTIGKLATLSVRGISGATTLMTRTTTFVLKLIIPSSLTSWLNRLVFSSLSQHSTIVDPVEAASHFVAYFNSEFSSTTTGNDDGEPSSSSGSAAGVMPEFQVCGHYDALNRARERSLFLVCYLHAPGHREAERFCAKTLSDPRVASLLNEKFVVWGGLVTRSRDAFRLAQGLRVSKYPCLAVLTSSSIIQNFGGLNPAMARRAAQDSSMALIALSEGFLSPENTLDLLGKVLEDHGPILIAAKAEQDERNFNRRIREEQEAAFAEALAEDQRKEAEREAQREHERQLQREQEERERQVLEEQARQEQKQQAVVQRRRERSESIPEEPSADGEKPVTRLLIKMPDGSRIQRRFLTEDKIRAVYDYVDSLESNTCFDYKLVTNFPRRVFDESTFSLTLKEADLVPQAALFLQSED